MATSLGTELHPSERWPPGTWFCSLPLPTTTICSKLRQNHHEPVTNRQASHGRALGAPEIDEHHVRGELISDLEALRAELTTLVARTWCFSSQCAALQRPEELRVLHEPMGDAWYMGSEVCALDEILRGNLFELTHVAACL